MTRSPRCFSCLSWHLEHLHERCQLQLAHRWSSCYLKLPRADTGTCLSAAEQAASGHEGPSYVCAAWLGTARLLASACNVQSAADAFDTALPPSLSVTTSVPFRRLVEWFRAAVEGSSCDPVSAGAPALAMTRLAGFRLLVEQAVRQVIDACERRVCPAQARNRALRRQPNKTDDRIRTSTLPKVNGSQQGHKSAQRRTLRCRSRSCR